jgi:hypothetical protein
VPRFEPGLCLSWTNIAAATYLKGRVGWLYHFELLVPARRVAHTWQELDDPELQERLRAAGHRLISFWDDEYTGQPVKMLTYRALDLEAVRLVEREYIGKSHALRFAWQDRYGRGRR